MALISAHSEETSDAIYGGDEEAIYEASVNDIDLYRLCSLIFNDFVGITTSEPEARARLAGITQTPPTAAKVKRRAEEEGSEEQSRGRADEDYILHRVPEDSCTSIKIVSPNAARRQTAANHQTPPTAPKDKRRAVEQEFQEDQGSSLEGRVSHAEKEEQGSSLEDHEYVVHRVPEHYDSCEAPETGPFCRDAVDALWAELSRPDDVDPPKRKRSSPPLPGPLSFKPSSGNQLPAICRPRHQPPNGSHIPTGHLAHPAQFLIRNPHSSTSAVAAPALPAPTCTPASLEIVKDFGYQGKVWRTIERLIENGDPTSMLSIQPTSSGKGRYAILLSQRPGKLRVVNTGIRWAFGSLKNHIHGFRYFSCNGVPVQGSCARGSRTNINCRPGECRAVHVFTRTEGWIQMFIVGWC